MTKGLISTLSYMYRFIAMGRGILSGDELGKMRDSAGVMADKAKDIVNAQAALEPISQDAATDLNEARLIDQHIDEMVDWLLRQEVV